MKLQFTLISLRFGAIEKRCPNPRGQFSCRTIQAVLINLNLKLIETETLLRRWYGPLNFKRRHRRKRSGKQS